MSERKTVYFERPGPVNTDKTLDIGIKGAQDLDVEFLIVPSITGKTALKALKRLEKYSSKNELQIICVTFRAGGAWSVGEESPAQHWKDIPELQERWKKWKEEGLEKVTFRDDIEERLKEAGIPIVRGTDIGASIDASMKNDLGVSTPLKILKESLYLLCPGFKVSVFSTLMAADAGKIPTDKEVISFGGTEQGVDTAAVIEPAYSDKIFNKNSGLEIREILCKPRSMMGNSGEYYDRGWK